MSTIAGIGSRILLLLLGIAFIWSGASSLNTLSGNLVAAQAGVVSSTEKYSDTGDKSYVISYKYQVEGVEYTDTFDSKMDYGRGSNVTVYYNPTSPELSFQSIEGSKAMGTILLLVGIVLVVFVAQWQWRVFLAMRAFAQEA